VGPYVILEIDAHSISIYNFQLGDLQCMREQVRNA
jgi:hypothetical protein